MALGEDFAAAVARNPDGYSVKRIAWAFACAKKDSALESTLYRLLVERVVKSRHAQ